MNDSITIIRGYFQYFLYHGIGLIFHFFFFFFFQSRVKKDGKGKTLFNMLICYNSVFLLQRIKNVFFFFEDERFDHDVNIIVFHKLKRSYRLMIKGYVCEAKINFSSIMERY